MKQIATVSSLLGQLLIKIRISHQGADYVKFLYIIFHVKAFLGPFTHCNYGAVVFFSFWHFLSCVFLWWIFWRFCGWCPEDHEHFQVIVSTYTHDAPNHRALCMDMLLRRFPERTRLELVSKITQQYRLFFKWNVTVFILWNKSDAPGCTHIYAHT